MSAQRLESSEYLLKLHESYTPYNFMERLQIQKELSPDPLFQQQVGETINWVRDLPPESKIQILPNSEGIFSIYIIEPSTQPEILM